MDGIEMTAPVRPADTPGARQAGAAEHLSLKEAQTLLRNLDDLDATLAQSLQQARGKHKQVATRLQMPDCPVVSNTQIGQLDDIQRGMSVMQSQKHELALVREGLRKIVSSGEAHAAKRRTWRQWLNSPTVQKVLAAGEMVGAMGFKFLAWNGVEAILPGDAEAFATPARIGMLITKRALLSILFAGGGEYILATDAPRRWLNGGGNLMTIMGIGQASDQAITLTGQFVTNPASGEQAPSYGQIIGFGLAGLGGVLQTGALNKPIERVVDFLRGGGREREDAIEFIDTAALEAAQRQGAQGQPVRADAPGEDLEQGFGPATRPARKASDLDALIDDLSTNDVPAMQAHIIRAFHSISEVHRALTPPTAQEAEEAAVTDALHEAIGQALLQPSPPQDPAAQIERFKQDLAAVLAAAGSARDALPPNDELRATIDTVFEDAKRMQEAVTGASETQTPHETAFLWAMAALGTTGVLLTFLGPATGNTWLSNLNHRAAIAGLTSSIGQNLANLGQFLGGAKPGDGRLKRFLRLGLDNENDNQIVKFAKNWGRNIQPLPLEFFPLKTASTFAQMGSVLRGKIAEAPLAAIPSFTTDRLMMETARLALAQAFMVFRLGHELQWNHYAAVAATLAGAATAAGTELRG